MDTVRTNSAYGTEPYLFSSYREQRGQCWVKSEWVNQVITNPEWILDEYVKTESEKPNKYRLSLKKKKKVGKFPLISLKSILEIYLQHTSQRMFWKYTLEYNVIPLWHPQNKKTAMN